MNMKQIVKESLIVATVALVLGVSFIVSNYYSNQDRDIAYMEIYGK